MRRSFDAVIVDLNAGYWILREIDQKISGGDENVRGLSQNLQNPCGA